MLLERHTSLVTRNLASTYSGYPCLLAVKKVPIKSTPAFLTPFTHQLIYIRHKGRIKLTSGSGVSMETTTKTAKEIYLDLKKNPNRARFGFGNKAVLVNIDPQKAYTATDEFTTAYETDPDQVLYINQLSEQFRKLGWPVVWTHVAYMESAEDAGVWGTRTDNENSLQNIKFNSRRSEFDDRLKIDPIKDVIYLKKDALRFF